MTNYERGNIILVPFPFSDQTTTKKRPAVVISSDSCNEISPDIIIMAITTERNKPLT
jgi:mRNA interferase MazF